MPASKKSKKEIENKTKRDEFLPSQKLELITTIISALGGKSTYPDTDGLEECYKKAIELISD